MLLQETFVSVHFPSRWWLHRIDLVGYLEIEFFLLLKQIMSWMWFYLFILVVASVIWNWKQSYYAKVLFIQAALFLYMCHLFSFNYNGSVSFFTGKTNRWFILLLQDYMNYRKYKYFRLDGSSTIQDRRDMVKDFQQR